MQPTRALTDGERLAWLRLIRTDQVGPSLFRTLLRRYGSASAALEALPDLARRGGRTRPLAPPPLAEAEAEWAALTRLGGRFVALDDPDYPPLLAAIDDAPPLIAVLGALPAADRRTVALVGARNASANGRRLATGLARDLGAAGVAVVSGLARGIDGAAHEGALATGTIAVLAGGVDVVYPPEHAGLYERIAADGAVVAECALGTQPQARHFPRRNRLISGLSLAVLVVEAAPRSGSLITARMAAEQGREVLAIPGSPLDPRARGCNGLIRDGATLVETADDVLEAIAAMAGTRPTPKITTPALPLEDLAPPPETPETVRALVLERLSPTATPVDELMRDCQLSAADVLTVLLEMELAGRIARHPGNRVSLISV
ncbi:MAG: DNA-processing protein DprA [Inquilinaceae bacterium]